MVSVPVREAPEMLAVTEYVTEPDPLPVPLDEIPIHGTLLVACHGHPESAVRETDELPPSDRNPWLLEASA